jgi:hypothetical protein
MEQVCAAPRESTSRMTVESSSPESMVASIDMQRGESGKVRVDMKGRWVSASCAGIKEGD